ncbi:TIM23 translocase complex subunit Tim15 [Schizosaccharomyces cryophilus OY26]|uniref:TIM23 translocase complex subunit Tim15 n=1 Tax=Schizosaccharomyces cryophilus (strain OY26 / ATCC MYA-4695 / CBS 11777 / NBRC 106824 / NRRL Y48691) TaxID=653667 RepID=S9VU74_SCHCR|nr:TIM23 translocase complex subunit Tim15 [Schizosaccharomyces cryophilus OY26]EPY49660.1 TIM23 translocase complex subunit Tim15 [Schizosaccharomyces cryophilus OY26]
MLKNLRILQRISNKYSINYLPHRYLAAPVGRIPFFKRQTDFSHKSLFHNSSICRNDAKVPISKSTGELEQPKPAYHITFTCTVCNHRSGHKLSKQAYHNGTVFVECPQCKNRHLMADHLKIFSDKRVTIEDIISNKGEILKKGYGQIVDGNVVEIEPDNLKLKTNLKEPSTDKSSSDSSN